MMGWIARIVVALVVAVVVYLVCIFVGGLIALMNVPLAAYVGNFLRSFAVVFAILAFLWTLFRGPTIAL